MTGPAEHDSRPVGTIWMLNLDEMTPDVVPLVPAEFRRVGLESLPLLASAINSVLFTEFASRLASGRQCYAAWVDGQLAAYGWVSCIDEHIGELNLRIKLLAGEAYIWDCVTLLGYREKRFYSALLAFILGELRAQGLCRAWIGADFENAISQKGMARAGFHHVADLVIQRLQGRPQARVIGLPGISEAIVAEARRAFLNQPDKVWLDSLLSGTEPDSTLT